MGVRPMINHARSFATAARPRVVAVGLGNMGTPLSQRVATQHATAVYDLNAEAVAAHVEATGSLAVRDEDELRTLTSRTSVVLTCLPNTDQTIKTLDSVRTALQPGTIWLDATSGRAEDAAALARELWEKHGVHYLDCAVSGGPRGAAKGILAALVGGDKQAYEGVTDVIGCFADKVTHLGPAGSGHLVKAINNALLAANLLSASEGVAAIQRYGIDVDAALQAINGSSGRSWVTMQRFPDNIRTGDAYGFALDMHCKDLENAMRVIRQPNADGSYPTAPMLEQTRCLMNLARQQMGGDVDHTETTRLAARANNIDFVRASVTREQLTRPNRRSEAGKTGAPVASASAPTPTATRRWWPSEPAALQHGSACARVFSSGSKAASATEPAAT